MVCRIALVHFILFALLAISHADVIITAGYSNGTTDDDSLIFGDAVTGSARIGGVSSAISTLGASSAEQGARFYGAVSGRGTGGQSQTDEGIIQTINVTCIWTITAEEWETYDFDLSAELHGRLNILDDAADESGDLASLSSLNATLSLNGSPVADTLGLSGGSRSTAGSSTFNDTASQTLSGLSGNNTITLQYSGTTRATWLHAVFQNNRTANAALWGSDGTMDGDTFPDTFDNYATSTERTGDGLFVGGIATLASIPEPTALSLIGIGSGCMFFLNRKLRDRTGQRVGTPPERGARCF